MLLGLERWRRSGGECVWVGGWGAGWRSGTGHAETLVRAVVVVGVGVSRVVVVVVVMQTRIGVFSLSVEGADATVFFRGNMDECLQTGEGRAGGVERGVAGRGERVSDGVGRRVGERRGHGSVLGGRRARRGKHRPRRRCRRGRRRRHYHWVGLSGGRHRGGVEKGIDRAWFLWVSHTAWLVRRTGLVVWTEQRCDGHPLRGHRRWDK